MPLSESIFTWMIDRRSKEFLDKRVLLSKHKERKGPLCASGGSVFHPKDGL